MKKKEIIFNQIIQESNLKFLPKEKFEWTPRP
jgi:hypothetical protein